MFPIVKSSSRTALVTAIIVFSSAIVLLLLDTSATPLFAQDEVSYRTPPIPFSGPQLAQSAPTSTEVTESAVVVQDTVTVAESSTVTIAVQPTPNTVSQTSVSVGLASSSTSSSTGRPRESASTIVERIAAASPPEPANVLGVARIGDDWQFPNVGPNERWMRVDLSEQMLYAYEGTRSIASFITSTGTKKYPTVTGTFRVRMKVSEQTMSGGVGTEAYSLPGVKWVMYFHSGYAFHGTYWHTNFGTPQSHGCVNLTEENAKWLFDFAGPVWDGQTTWFPSTESNPGSLVLVHQ